MRFSGYLLCWAIGLSLVGCRNQEASEPVIRPVRYQQVFATGGTRVRTFSGVAQAAVESPLSFRVGGTVRTLVVGVGAAVNAGQLLAELDAEDFRLRVQQAEASLRQAQAQAANASTNYERTRLLYENANASKSDLDQARYAAESADALVEAGVNTLALRRLELDYTQLRAPFAGSVSGTHVEVNENVRPGQPVVTEASSDRLEVLVATPEMLVGQIARGDPVTVTFDALPGQTMTARVTEIGVAATGLATFPVTVRLEGENPGVRVGMAAEVAFAFEATDDRERFYVPSLAVDEDRDGRFVFVVTPIESGLGLARRRPVEVGALTPEGVEILSGLSDGDLVVTAGVTQITDSLVVRIAPPATVGSD